MCGDVLPRDVRDESLISIPFFIDHQAALGTLGGTARAQSTYEQPEFEGHVEAWEAVHGVERRSRDVMEPEPALVDNSANLIHAHFASIDELKSGSCYEAAIEDGKNDCPKDG